MGLPWSRYNGEKEGGRERGRERGREGEIVACVHMKTKAPRIDRKVRGSSFAAIAAKGET